MMRERGITRQEALKIRCIYAKQAFRKHGINHILPFLVAQNSKYQNEEEKQLASSVLIGRKFLEEVIADLEALAKIVEQCTALPSVQQMHSHVG